MVLNIMISNDKQKDVYEVLEKVHNSLAGNRDYIDSNIILNCDVTGPQECTILILADSCVDKETMRNKVKEAIDMFIDKL